MSENTGMIQLELGDTAVAVQEPQTIELPATVPTMEAVMDIYTQQAGLTEADLKAVDEFSEKIDLKDSGIILQYGAACQKKIAIFSTLFVPVWEDRGI